VMMASRWRLAHHPLVRWVVTLEDLQQSPRFPTWRLLLTPMPGMRSCWPTASPWTSQALSLIASCTHISTNG
ncbi:unnamed protein product, partial [Polarella glacialis]